MCRPILALNVFTRVGEVALALVVGTRHKALRALRVVTLVRETILLGLSRILHILPCDLPHTVLDHEAVEKRLSTLYLLFDQVATKATARRCAY